MSVYKVPQDVEADDKLLGPFSPRQFVYLLVSVILIGLAWFLSTIFLGLIIIPLPFILIFGALALPLRKEQPMEAYFAAIISFSLKNNKRLWQPDGLEHTIEISAPRHPEPDRTKGIRREEAVHRLSYLADIVDTEGWAIKHAVSEQDAKSGRGTFTPIDIQEDAQLNQNIDRMLAQQTADRQNQILSNMNAARNMADYSKMGAQEIQQRTYSVNPMNLYAGKNRQDFSVETPRPQYSSETLAAVGLSAPNYGGTNGVLEQSPTEQNPQTSNFESQAPDIQFNPYPSGINQSVISPVSNQNQTLSQKTSKDHSAKNNMTAAQSQILNEIIQREQESKTPPKINPQDLSQQEVSTSVTNQEDAKNIEQEDSRSSNQETEEISKSELAQKIHQEKIENLVENGKDLSVETLGKQAKRFENEVDLEEDEVIISLR